MQHRQTPGRPTTNIHSPEDPPPKKQTPAGPTVGDCFHPPFPQTTTKKPDPPQPVRAKIWDFRPYGIGRDSAGDTARLFHGLPGPSWSEETPLETQHAGLGWLETLEKHIFMIPPERHVGKKIVGAWRNFCFVFGCFLKKKIGVWRKFCWRVLGSFRVIEDVVAQIKKIHPRMRLSRSSCPVKLLCGLRNLLLIKTPPPPSAMMMMAMVC